MVFSASERGLSSVVSVTRSRYIAAIVPFERRKLSRKVLYGNPYVFAISVTNL